MGCSFIRGNREKGGGGGGLPISNMYNYRLKLIGADNTITPEYKERDSGDKFVFRLELKMNKTKVDFKCTDPTQIRAPKAFKDPDAFNFQFTADDIKLMVNAKSAMQADTVTFTTK